MKIKIKVLRKTLSKSLLLYPILYIVNISDTKYSRHKRFTSVENVIRYLPKVTWSKFLESDNLFYQCKKVWQLQEPFPKFLGLSELHFRSLRN